MPPHCDSIDGPVVTAAARALESGDVDVVLPYVPEAGEPEIRAAFDSVVRARESGGDARDVADRWFFETVVRVHRAGEGAPFTGLRPAGGDHGPILPIAERAIESGSPDELADALCRVVREQVELRLRLAADARSHANGDLHANRAAVSAALDLEVWAHKLFVAATAATHAHGGHEHG
jgi:hypothetical protein